MTNSLTGWNNRVKRLVTLTAHIWSGRGVAGTQQPVSSCSRLWQQEVSHLDGNVTSELQQVNRTRKQHVLSDHNNSNTSARATQTRHTSPGRLATSRTRFHGEYRSASKAGRITFMIWMLAGWFVRPIKLWYLLLFQVLGIFFPPQREKLFNSMVSGS